MVTPFSFKVGRRSFSFSTDFRIHSYFRFTESTPAKNLSIPLDKILLPWLQECFTRLCELPLTHKFFIETRVHESSVWLEKQSGKHGHSAELAKIDGNGKTSKIFIPIGEGKKGWKDFLHTLDSFMKAEKKPSPLRFKAPSSVHPQQNRDLPKQSFRDVLCKKQSTTSVPTDLELLPPTSSSSISQSTIIIHRKCFHDSWKGIESAMRINYSSSLSINPFQPDKALCFCIDQEQAATMTNIKDWYLIGRYWVRFSPRSPELFRAPSFIPSYGGWIKIRDLPLDKWNLENFKLIGDACGGYLQTAQKTLAMTELLIAHIKVRSNSFGFLPASISLPSSPSSSMHVEVWIVPFFSKEANLGYRKRIHGSIPYPTDHPPSSALVTQVGLLGSSPSSSTQTEGDCSPRANTESQPTTLFKDTILHLAVPRFCAESGLDKEIAAISKVPKSCNRTRLYAPKVAAPPTSCFPDVTRSHVLNGLDPSTHTSLYTLGKNHKVIPGPAIEYSVSPSSVLSSPFKHNLPSLPLFILDEYSPSFLSPLPTSTLPSPHSSTMANHFSSRGKEIAGEKGKAPIFTQGIVQSTNSPFSFSDSDIEYCSSPGYSSPPDSPLSDKALMLQPSESVPNLGLFFNECEDFDPLAIPLRVDFPTNNQLALFSDGDGSHKALALGSTDGEYEQTVSCIPEQTEPSLDIEQVKEAPLIDLENPATLLPILIPWLSKLGLCISTIPPVKRSVAAKKKAKGTRELINLSTSVFYPSKSPTTKRLGASSRADSS